MPETVDTSSIKSRKILPQPIESSSRSSKGRLEREKPENPLRSTESASHLFIPSNGALQSKLSGRSNAEPLRNESPEKRRLPEPVETIRMSYRRGGSDTRENSFASGFRIRRFAPQILETARRSFRKDSLYPRCHSDPSELQSENTKIDTSSSQTQSPLVAPESRFSYSSLLRRGEGTRRRSFRVSDLPPIPSSCSEDSNGSGLPSLSASASPSERVKDSRIDEQRRESCDEKFSEYLLSLAARSAKKRLKERALAAFPNEQVYQPVDHFAIDTEEDDSLSDRGLRPGGRKQKLSTYRRTSSTDLSWELRYMCHNKEEAEMKRQAKVGSKETGSSSSPTHQILNTAREIQGTADDHWQDGASVTQATSPPMLGEDLIFPQSSSPDGTIYENKNAARHRQMIFEQRYGGRGGLWCANLGVNDKRGDGLWMGTCRRASKYDGESRETLQPELKNPIHDHIKEAPTTSNGLTASKYAGKLPSNPSVKGQDLENVGRELNSQDYIEKEFHDGFVTQIYNYLSLGYPCVAHYYDHELSKISSIPVKELRRDDFHTDAKGYVSVDEATAGNTKSTGRTCMRWVALRLYIHEWAKHQPRTTENDNNLEAWGVCERKGSWAG